jgi:hypothetical protein
MTFANSSHHKEKQSIMLTKIVAILVALLLAINSFSFPSSKKSLFDHLIFSFPFFFGGTGV